MKISFCILTIILFPLLMSCNKEENIDFNPPENIEHINYYVKYEASCNSKYFGNVMKISVKTESGTQAFEGGDLFLKHLDQSTKVLTAKSIVLTPPIQVHIRKLLSIYTFVKRKNLLP